MALSASDAKASANFASVSASQISELTSTAEFSLKKLRLAQIAAALKSPEPIIKLREKLGSNQTTAQSLALADGRVKNLARGQSGNQPLLLEVFGVYPLRQRSDNAGAQSSAQTPLFPPFQPY